ncbi:ead/Ea22-like family protein [Enterobacter sp. BNK-16]|uniref:ead/Ea22-like family protein n=1 Tax=Enterobacter sp. BNK-16 TaxID=3376153 RepID=UPI003B5079DE
MSNIDKRALREAADSVIQKYGSEWFETGRQLCTVHKSKIELIAAANPATVLALLDELEAKDKCISELKSAIKSANERYENRTPTQWAYDQACLAIEKHRTRADSAEKRIAELEAKLDTADKLQDSAFRHGLQHGFSLGQTDNQAGFEECLSAYGTGKGEAS